MRVHVDGLFFVRVVCPERPGENVHFALERLGWVELDGVREQKPLLIAVYSSQILLLRDLTSDACGRLVLQGELDAIAGFVSETRRLAEAVQVAFEKLNHQQADHV